MVVAGEDGYAERAAHLFHRDGFVSPATPQHTAASAAAPQSATRPRQPPPHAPLLSLLRSDPRHRRPLPAGVRLRRADPLPRRRAARPHRQLHALRPRPRPAPRRQGSLAVHVLNRREDGHLHALPRTPQTPTRSHPEHSPREPQESHFSAPAFQGPALSLGKVSVSSHNNKRPDDR
eukprot:COSAG04_NODE_2255_length_4440_cov_25.402952_9_plen_177_part_00